MNEFKILNNIGKGSFSKVKRVQRIIEAQTDDKVTARKKIGTNTAADFF